MPPDPVLALLSIVGFFLYVTVGSAASQLYVKRRRAITCEDCHNALHKGDNCWHWENRGVLSFVLALMWPLGVVVLVGVGGWRLGRLIMTFPINSGRYLANALDSHGG
jgi:hypothetical protein